MNQTQGSLTAALRGGTFISARGERIAVAPHEVGRLAIRSGRVVVCDPLVPMDAAPLERPVPAGEHRVVAALARYPDGDQRVAAAYLLLGSGEPIAWQLATRAGESLAELGPGEIYGYGVDAGTGCFADADAMATIDTEAGSEALLAALDASRGVTFSFAVQEGLVAFSSGIGDGFYASYWGCDASGALVALATDFGLLVDPDDLVLHFPPEGPFAHDELRASGATLRALALPGRGLLARLRRVPAAGPSYEITGRTSVDLALVLADGRRAPAGGQVTVEDGRKVYSFDRLPPGARLRVTVHRGVRPMALEAGGEGA